MIFNCEKKEEEEEMRKNVNNSFFYSHIYIGHLNEVYLLFLYQFWSKGHMPNYNEE